MGNREEQESGALRVVDKRRFTSEGDTREDSPSATVAPGVAAEKPAARLPESDRPQRQPSEPMESLVEGSLPPVDFSSFVVSLATQALVMLGEIPNPETNTRIFNREAAQHTIDIISMLEKKSEGNLSADELNLMNEVLTSLRLAFVKKVKEHDYSKTPA